LKRAAILRAVGVPAGFALLFAVLFSPVLFGHRLLTDGGDGVRFALAAYLRVPSLWEPAVMLGYPWSANLAGFWDPLAAALRAMPGTFNLYMFAAYVIAALGAYRLVFQTTRSVLGGSIAGLSYAMGGFMIGHLGHYDLVHPGAWTPWILWSLTALRERAGAGRIAAGAVFVALAAVSGGPQVLAYTLVAGVILVAALGIRSVHARAYAIACVATVLLGIGLAGIALVPAAHLAAASVRAHIAFDRFISDSLPLGELPIRVFFPYFLGVSQSAVYPFSHIATGSWVELSCYAGITPLVLAVIALRSGYRDRHVLAWAIVLVVAFALSTGNALKLASITSHLPVLGLFRAQGRYALDTTLAIAVLAGYGAHAIERGSVNARAIAAALVLVGTIMTLTLVAIAAFGGPVAAAIAARAGYPALPLDPVHNPALGIPVAVFVLGALAVSIWSRRPRSRVVRAVVVAAVCIDLASFAWFGTWHDSVVTDADITMPSALAPLANDATLERERVRFIATGAPWPFDPDRSLVWNVPTAVGHVQLEVARTAAFLHVDEDGNTTPEEAADATHRNDALAAVRYLVLPANSSGIGPLASATTVPDLGVRIGSPAWTARSWVGRDRFTAAFARPIPATRIAIESSLNDAVGILDRAPVADVLITTSSGKHLTMHLLAGRDTAERGYDLPNVRSVVRHARATIASSDGAGNTYRTSLVLAQPTPIVSLTIAWRNADPDHGYMNIDRIAIDDDRTGTAYPVTPLTTLEADPTDWTRVDSDAPLLVFKNRHAGGRAWLVYDVVDGTAETAPTILDSPAFDPAREAVAEGVQPLQTRAGPGDGARITRLTATQMMLDVSCAARCYLVTSDAYDPGWSARIDDRPAPLYVTDEAIRGVFIPPGRHAVEFFYRPAGLALGVAISIGSALALGTLGLLEKRRRRPPFAEAG